MVLPTTLCFHHTWFVLNPISVIALCRMASKDNNDESRQREPLSQRAVQLLDICANFPVYEINGFDWHQGRCIYVQCEGKIQEIYTSYLILYLLHALCLVHTGHRFK
jgi:hypothetical protein